MRKWNHAYEFHSLISFEHTVCTCYCLIFIIEMFHSFHLIQLWQQVLWRVAVDLVKTLGHVSIYPMDSHASVREASLELNVN